MDAPTEKVTHDIVRPTTFSVLQTKPNDIHEHVPEGGRDMSPVQIFICTAADMDWGRQLCLLEELERMELLKEFDANADPVCPCERSSWVTCPELETCQDTHDEETCPYGCFEGTVPCPVCQGFPEPPLIRDPYMDAPPPEPDPIEAAFNEWIAGKHP